ncbi:Muramoyltetrapeptide carboxypeptidase [Chloroherpeton thalassium ATCC 35110]|uniref:Muramoyltetrapeptide carboxypeptidase n=1 Tax=Chloroherpeton thalassium (strain ATCC 35110 / GB-78) TaxID=517418 RepID=B3QUP4_CHLT3|nr:LD-carboxypeptidase [Chloroherpeton thalassium]ACF12950.1 Muramoyltetrapeptide carboxypeptidase [Chloroherpeton thalassium ATCC 35110]
MVLKPKRLAPGDVIGLVAPASPIENVEKIEQAAHYLESQGYWVKYGAHIRKAYGYLAGTDEERAEDLNRMFADPDVTAIFCLRGGYGSPRILKLLDYDLIARNPKILAGYSDITALSLAIFAKTGLITFSAPMLTTDFANTDVYAFEAFWKMITIPDVFGHIENHPLHERKPLKEGIAIGRLFGGNLSLCSVLVGTEFMPKLDDAIFFAEDIGEEPYRVDRLLSQLENANILAHLSGLIFGQFTNAIPKHELSLTMEDVFARYVAPLKENASAMSGLSYGHVKHKHVLPVGAKAKLGVAAAGCELEILESVVS